MSSTAGFAPKDKSQEEEDHLIRSKKKIKNNASLGEEAMEITEEGASLPHPPNPPSQSLNSSPKKIDTPAEGPKSKSFKDALAAPRSKDFYFNELEDNINSDEEDEDGDTDIQDESSSKREDGVPTIALPKKVDHRKELCRFKAIHRKQQITQNSKSSPVGEPPTGTETPQTALSVDNGHLQQLGLEEGDTNFGPWMLVQRRSRRPPVYKKAHIQDTNPISNRYAELGQPSQQKEDHVRGKKVTSSGHEKGAYHSQIAPKPITPTIKAAKLPLDPTTSSKLGNSETQLATCDPSQLPATYGQGSVPFSPNKLPTQPVNIIHLQVDPKSPEIPMTELIEESPTSNLPPPPTTCSPLTHTHTPTTNPQTSLVDGDSRHSKPPDPGSHHGGPGFTPVPGPHVGGQYDESVIRTRDRSHSPHRHNLVDRAAKGENRTKLEYHTRDSSALMADGIHEVSRPRSP
ncbi:hypothetical protein LOK49_LG12G00889 [Camellia lanceoleosa]|uniref:Uncharacterized protein n=1 Tax=Camellia lanceoleosa TaxID=1840588 RepID=A0ACC0FRB9_9ERIC|nr:hypothetical protein LOK49_LG12G00889 [Camellia lanceoleosa]